VINHSAGLRPANQRFHSSRALLLTALLLLPFAQSNAAIFSEDALNALTDDSASKTSLNPSIDTEGRIGAEAFARANIAPGKGGLDELQKIARDAIAANPKSGLAHEVLGTALFYSGNFPAALTEFQTATRLEPTQTGPWTKLGIVQMELDKLEDAEKSLLTALKQKPDNRVANQRLGLLYEYQQKNAQAIQYFQKGLAGTDSNYLGVALNLGRLLNQAGLYTETIKHLAARVPLNSRITEAHAILATAYLETNQYDDAAKHFSKALEASPDAKANPLGLAIAQRQQKDNEAALKTLTELIKKYPDWRSAHVEQGELFLQMNRVADAEKSFAKAISFGTNSNYTDAKLAEYYTANNNPTKAKTLYQRIIASGKAIPQAYVKFAELMRSENDLQSGVALLREGTKQYPQNSYLHFRLANELATLRQYQQALASIELANQLQPNDASILRSYSLILSKLGKSADAANKAGQLYKLQNAATPEALFYATQLQANNQLQDAAGIYTQIIKSEPENLIALNNLANVLAEQDNLPEAETHARKANQLVKDNAQIMDTLGWIVYQQKRYSEATEIFTQAIKIAPKAAVIHYHAGVVLDDSGKDADAIPRLKQALALDSKATWANDAKQRLSTLN